MNKINGKNFWIIYATFCIALLLLFSSLAFLDYSLILGYLVGTISFLVFIGMIKIVLKMINKSYENSNKVNNKKKLASNFFIAILVSALTLLLNAGIFSLFIWINYYYHHKHNETSKIAFFPFNAITMTAPYLLLSVFYISWGFIMLVKIKKNREIDMKGE